MDAFGDGKGKVAPLLVSLLFVWRDGIMDEGLYTSFGEVKLQLVAPFAPHGKNVEDVAEP